MKNAARISIALAVVASLGLAVAALDVVPGNFGGQAASQISDSDTTLLAARYHLRGRTTRFFQRSSGSSSYYRGSRYYRAAPAAPAVRPAAVPEKSAPAKKPATVKEPATAKKADVAGRYHLRTRTRRFFNRSVSGDMSTSQDLQLAGRYHLRTRTTRFFNRATV